MTNILEIKNLSKSYNNKPALINVSFDLPQGKIAGLLGPNGSGKTTLIKIVTGLLSRYEGSVTIMGNPPGALANADISYLPDKAHLPTWLTVNQGVNFFEDFYNDFDRERAEEMLNTMKIPMESKLKHLSRGQQEKVQMSLVMSRNAKIYILDEPIGAVDPASRDFIIETILKNRRPIGSILLSTHIISDIEQILDIAVFLKEGEVLISGCAEELKKERENSLDGIFREVFKHVV